MKSIFQQVKTSLGKPYDDLEFLLTCFSEVLIENNETHIAACIPWITANEADFNSGNPEKILRMYSICFQLLNLAEVNGAVQNRRRKFETDGPENINGLWNQSIADLKNKGIEEDEIMSRFKSIHVEPVLTAHPTEAKRPVILSLYRQLYLLVVKRENKMYNLYEQAEIKEEIKSILHNLWFIGEIYMEKPAVESELENILHYFSNVFPEVLPFLDTRLIQALQDAGFCSSKISDTSLYPKISFGNWVGGDRDGHPFVTSTVTEKTLQKLRLQALKLVNSMLVELAEKMGIYSSYDKLEHLFLKRMTELETEPGPHQNSFSLEPFRHFINLLKNKLPIIERQGGGIELNDSQFSYKNSGELHNDLQVLKNALIDFGAISLAQNDVQKLIRHLDVFGFHLAHIDIRQNSNTYENSLLDIIKISLPSQYETLQGNKVALQKFILAELANNRPFINRIQNLESEQAKEALRTFHVLGKHIHKYSERALGSLIVSMTRNAYDLFTVYLFVREAGLSHYSVNGPVCPLPVVPLIETIEDLKESPKILDEFLSHPITKNSLQYIQKRKNHEKPIQEIMIGYSDSNKDGGILASAWYLSFAQMKLSEIGRKHGIDIMFFHGKGGTISRGAGPAHWFLKSLPHNTLQGSFRITEQGETIERKYANKVNAAYNLELLLAGVTHRTLLNTFEQNEFNSIEIELFTFLANESYKTFKKLTTHPLFIQFYEQATPLDAIESSKIGSRPVRRTGQHKLSDLRAIPWVFSWNQSRMQVSGWFGVGSTLQALQQQNPDLYKMLKQFIKTNNFVRYLFTNIDTALSSTDKQIISLYCTLVEEKDVESEIKGLLLQELDLSQKMIEQLLPRPQIERRRSFYFSTKLRAEALLPLHKEQIKLLKKWRMAQKQNNENESKQVLILLLKSINAIASALGTTG